MCFADDANGRGVAPASTFTRSACVVLEFNLTDVKMLSNNCSILLIDDDADVLDAYTQLLEQAGIMSVPVIIRLMRGSRCRRTGPASF